MEGRSPEERRAAAEARARARAGRPPETGDEEVLETAEPRETERAERGRARPSISRHYGGGDIYRRRRLVAAAAALFFVVILLALIAGC